MRLFKVTLIFFTVLGSVLTLPMTSIAAQFCIKNAAEFAEKKAQIPKVLQNLQKEPAIFAGKDWKAAAAIKIYFTESGFKLDANVVPSIGSPYFDSSHIKNVCFEDDIITVTGNNNESFEVKVKSESSVYFKSMTFSASTPAQFAALADQVVKAGADKVSSKANSNNNGGTH